MRVLVYASAPYLVRLLARIVGIVNPTAQCIQVLHSNELLAYLDSTSLNLVIIILSEHESTEQQLLYKMRCSRPDMSLIVGTHYPDDHTWLTTARATDIWELPLCINKVCNSLQLLLISSAPL